MKILIVNKFLFPNGGSETYIFEIGKQLISMGHDVQYFGMEHEGRVVGNELDCYTQNIDFHQATVLDKLKYPFQIIYSSKAKHAITEILKAFHPDVVHFNNINFQLTPSVIEAVHQFDPKIRMVYTAHDYQWVCPNHLLRIPKSGNLCQACIDGNFSSCIRNHCIHGSMARSVLGAREGYYYRKRKTYRLIDTVICPSKFMETILLHNPDLQGKTTVLHNFLSNISFDDANYQKTNNGSFVLYFGRYDLEKGIRTALSAARALPNISFVFAGKGECEEEVKKAATESGNITELGFLSGQHLADVIKNAAFSIFPSEWYENCPFSVVESQLYGTPVLASNLGGTPELLLEGVTGETFTPGTSEILSEKINSLWTDKSKLTRYQDACQQYAACGRKKLGLLSCEEYCEKLLKIYRGE